jgi:hypothetical protein
MKREINIPLSHGYYAHVDENNWSLAEERKDKRKDGTPNMSYLSHHHTPGQLLKALANAETVRGGPRSSIESIIAFHDAVLLEAMDRLLDRQGELLLAMKLNPSPLVNDSMLS